MSGTCTFPSWEAADALSTALPNAGWRNPQFQGYADHMATGEFRTGLERLLSLSPPVAVMCAEGLWWQCHRRMVADALLARGIDVEHIRPDGRRDRHELTEFAMVEGERVTYPPAQASPDQASGVLSRSWRSSSIER